jgi:hypothetical protein
MNKRFLKFEVVWKDEHMFEIKVSADNGRYSGTTEVYETKESLLPFAHSLEGFLNGSKKLSHSCGERNSYAFFQVKFYPVDTGSVVGVHITLEENVATEYREEEKDKLTMELIVEPNAIDIFQKELVSLAINEEGSAELIGIDRYLQ